MMMTTSETPNSLRRNGEFVPLVGEIKYMPPAPVRVSVRDVMEKADIPNNVLSATAAESVGFPTEPASYVAGQAVRP